MTAKPWTLLLVDDHPVVRAGLTSLIDAEPDLRVIGHAEDMAGALAAVDALLPDLVLVDLSLKDSSGLDLVKELARRAIKSMVVSMHEAPTWAERALAAGARGYVFKSEAGRNIVQAIRRVRAGRVYLNDALSTLLLERRIATPASEHALDPMAALTDRELEVLARIGKGWTTRQISDALELSAKTVQTYRERIKRKLALDSSAALSSTATRWVVDNMASPED